MIKISNDEKRQLDVIEEKIAHKKKRNVFDKIKLNENKRKRSFKNSKNQSPILEQNQKKKKKEHDPFFNDLIGNNLNPFIDPTNELFGYGETNFPSDWTMHNQYPLDQFKNPLENTDDFLNNNVFPFEPQFSQKKSPKFDIFDEILGGSSFNSPLLSVNPFEDDLFSSLKTKHSRNKNDYMMFDDPKYSQIMDDDNSDNEDQMVDDHYFSANPNYDTFVYNDISNVGTHNVNQSDMDLKDNAFNANPIDDGVNHYASYYMDDPVEDRSLHSKNYGSLYFSKLKNIGYKDQHFKKNIRKTISNQTNHIEIEKNIRKCYNQKISLAIHQKIQNHYNVRNVSLLEDFEIFNDANK